MLKRKLIYFLFITILLLNCSNENDTTDTEINSIHKSEAEMAQPNFRDLLLNGTTAKYAPPTIRTESDLVGVDSPGCYNVNVRVYISVDGGNEYLVANDNVLVGDCNNGNRGSSDPKCNGYLPDGNYVYENGTQEDICLYELLIENETAYNQYLASVSRFLN